MSRGGLTLVTTPAGGWCDPVTGLCHIEPAEAGGPEAGEPEAGDQTATGAPERAED